VQQVPPGLLSTLTPPAIESNHRLGKRKKVDEPRGVEEPFKTAESATYDIKVQEKNV
jgi:hypothetical protein